MWDLKNKIGNITKKIDSISEDYEKASKSITIKIIYKMIE